MQRITDDIYRLTQFVGLVAYYLLRTPDGFAVIDTGVNAGIVDQLTHGLETLGASLDDVRHILITHEHPDHIGGLPALQARTTATTITHTAAAPVVRGETAPRSPDPDTLTGMARFMATRTNQEPPPPSIVDRTVSDEDALDDVAPGLRVIALPGHADGQVGYYHAPSGTLFGGDVIANWPLIGISYPVRSASPDWDAVKTSIQRVRELNPRRLLIGHGRVIEGDVAAQLAALVT